MTIEKVKKLFASLHDKTEYVIHIINLKQALNHGLVLKKVHRVIKFVQKAWLKAYIDVNTELRNKAKNNFEKDFSKLINNLILEKPWKMFENIGTLTTEKGRNYLLSEPNIILQSFLQKICRPQK